MDRVRKWMNNMERYRSKRDRSCSRPRSLFTLHPIRVLGLSCRVSTVLILLSRIQLYIPIGRSWKSSMMTVLWPWCVADHAYRLRWPCARSLSLHPRLSHALRFSDLFRIKIKTWSLPKKKDQDVVLENFYTVQSRDILGFLRQKPFPVKCWSDVPNCFSGVLTLSNIETFSEVIPVLN